MSNKDTAPDPRQCDNCKHGPRLDQDDMEAYDVAHYPVGGPLWKQHPCEFCMRNQPYSDNWEQKV